MGARRIIAGAVLGWILKLTIAVIEAAVIEPFGRLRTIKVLSRDTRHQVTQTSLIYLTGLVVPAIIRGCRLLSVLVGFTLGVAIGFISFTVWSTALLIRIPHVHVKVLRLAR